MKSLSSHISLLLLLSFMFYAGCRENNTGFQSALKDLSAENLPYSSFTGNPDGFSTQIDSGLKEMIGQLRSMSPSEIENLSKKELLDLGSPLLDLIRNASVLNDLALEASRRPLTLIAGSVHSITFSEYKRLSKAILDAILPVWSLGQHSREIHKKRKLDATQLRAILLELRENENSSRVCESLFNVTDGYVILLDGDYLNGANALCPSGTTFFLIEGNYTGQSVKRSRPGNRWIGVGNAVLEGNRMMGRAFENGLENNFIYGIKIRNYTLHGIYSRSDTKDLLIRNVSFYNIAPDSNGQEYGAVQMDFARNIEVTESSFENVASGIRFGHSEGPLKVTRNEALNSGRNFFQCNNCVGHGIRINYNSLRHEWLFGIDPLEDWINLHLSEGIRNDYIQVNHNRAYGRSRSVSGSFILLGDEGGRYQEAIGNIGVNPGQIGIGIAGGEHIRVKQNRMYSNASSSGNVAYYSVGFVKPCSQHLFPNPDTPEANRAHWQLADGRLNHAWSDGACGITNEEINYKVVDDTTMSPEIWHEWKFRIQNRDEESTDQTNRDPRTLPGFY